jgi:hypothetical protein
MKCVLKPARLCAYCLLTLKSSVYEVEEGEEPLLTCMYTAEVWIIGELECYCRTKKTASRGSLYTHILAALTMTCDFSVRNTHISDSLWF